MGDANISSVASELGVLSLPVYSDSFEEVEDVSLSTSITKINMINYDLMGYIVPSKSFDATFWL